MSAGTEESSRLTQQTSTALPLCAKKCPEIWTCVTQEKARLIAQEPSPRGGGGISASGDGLLTSYREVSLQRERRRWLNVARSRMAFWKKEV